MSVRENESLRTLSISNSKRTENFVQDAESSKQRKSYISVEIPKKLTCFCITAYTITRQLAVITKIAFS